MTRSARVIPALLALLALSLTGASTASAGGIDSSTITSPKDGVFLVSSSPADTITITGTAQGDNILDLRCYYGNNVATLFHGTAVVNGTFSQTIPQSLLPTHTCRLEAVAQGDTGQHAVGSDDPAYAGVTIGRGDYALQHYGGAAGPPEYWNWAQAAGTHGVTMYDAGSCGLTEATAFDPVTLTPGASLWECAGYFHWADKTPFPTRSDLRVDGDDAYLTRSWYSIPAFGHNDPLSPTLAVTAHALDPKTGDISVDEVHRPSFCGSPVYPPAPCGVASRAPVQLARHTQTIGGGRITRTIDTWTSTDGQAHQLDLLPAVQNAGAPAGFRFPGQAAAITPSAGSSVAIGGTAPAQIVVQADVAALGGLSGAVVSDPPPADVRFISDTEWHLHSTATVPATGSFVQRTDWITAPTAAAASALAAQSADGDRAPTIAIAAPAAGATLTASPITVTGSSADAGAVAPGVTVNGVAATVKADGTWSAKVPAVAGPVVLTAVAKDGAGNTATVSRSVTLKVSVPKDVTPPVLSAVSLSRRTFRIGTKRTAAAGVAKARATGGATVRWTVSEPGTTTFTVRRSTKAGLKGRGRTLRRTTAKAGAHRIAFSGRIGSRRLARGRYRLSVRAADAAGNRSRTRTVSFTVVR